MFGLTRKDNQIIGVIIALIAVNMVNYFAGEQLPTKFFRGNDTMLCLSADFSIFRRMSIFVLSATYNAAIFATSFLLVNWSKVKRFFAMQTLPYFSGPSGNGVTRLGAPLPFARLTAVFASIHRIIITHSADKTNGRFSPHCLNPVDELPLFRRNGHAPQVTP